MSIDRVFKSERDYIVYCLSRDFTSLAYKELSCGEHHKPILGMFVGKDGEEDILACQDCLDHYKLLLKKEFNEPYSSLEGYRRCECCGRSGQKWQKTKLGFLVENFTTFKANDQSEIQDLCYPCYDAAMAELREEIENELNKKADDEGAFEVLGEDSIPEDESEYDNEIWSGLHPEDEYDDRSTSSRFMELM